MMTPPTASALKPISKRQRLLKRWSDAPTDATMFTHSCSRYFSSCSLLPLCADTAEQRKHVFENEMVVQKWNPLAELEGREDV